MLKGLSGGIHALDDRRDVPLQVFPREITLLLGLGCPIIAEELQKPFLMPS